MCINCVSILTITISTRISLMLIKVKENHCFILKLQLLYSNKIVIHAVHFVVAIIIYIFMFSVIWLFTYCI